MHMKRERAAFVGMIRDHKTRIGRIKATRGGPAGREGESGVAER